MQEKALVPTYEQAVETWGAENVQRLSLATPEERVLDAATQGFIARVGVPKDPDWFGITFLDGTYDSPMYAERPQIPDGWVTIGSIYDGDMPICVSTTSVEVWSFPCYASTPPFLINSTVEAFVTFLYLFCRDWQDAARLDPGDEERQKRVATIESEWRVIDPRALDESGSYWAATLEQIQDGILG